MSNLEGTDEGENTTNDPPFVYNPPTLREGDDQGYKPLFQEGPVMRAAGPMSMEQPQTLNKFEQGPGASLFYQFDNAPPALDFGNKSATPKGCQSEPVPLDFGFGHGEISKKPVVVRPEAEPILEKVSTRQLSPREKFEESIQTTGVCFQSSATDQRVFHEVVTAFGNIGICDSEAQPNQQRVVGFSTKGRERCEFSSRLLRKSDGQWFVDVQRVSGSRAPFFELIQVLSNVLGTAAALTNVRLARPPSPVAEISAGAAADSRELDQAVLTQGPKENEQNGTAHLLEMTKSEYLDVQRQGFEGLSHLSASAAGRSSLMESGANVLVGCISSALASPDAEMKWNGSVLLANMTLFKEFCQNLVDILAILLDVLLLHVSCNVKRTQANVSKAVERTLAVKGSESAFRKHLNIFQKLKQSSEPATQTLALLVLASLE